mmetsp:Transcript_16515/g.15843  ORF Transcript_16515/g.15843 Transcript_16515/m.15843 type:complete len:115 (-) Transcript_16515:9-353(-)
MMYSVVSVLALVSVATAFTPVGRVASSSSLSMKLEGAARELVGSDLEFPEFDPWGFTKDADENKMAWYRAAELKHGRIAMVASLGQIFQYYVRLGDPVFNQGDKPFAAYQQVVP